MTERRNRDGAALSEAKRAVVTVGDGRGFVVEHRFPLVGRERTFSLIRRLVITAAHCLPHLPPNHAALHWTPEKRTYTNLIGPLGQKPTVWAECLFVDPVSDLAVLGTPDNQVLFDEADAYEALTDAASPVSIAGVPKDGIAYLLSLDGRWFPCTVATPGYMSMSISNAAQAIVGGMSGSPVVRGDGSAVGVVCVSSGDGETPHTNGEGNPLLVSDLPGWLLKQVRKKVS